MTATAQREPGPEHRLKAVFIHHFSQFIKWPPSAFADEGTPFVIGILGHDPFGSYIDSVVAGEQHDGRPIVIRRFKTIQDADTCHILYAGTSADAEKIAPALQGKPVLTVGENKTFITTGGVMRFIEYNNKIRIEINLANAKKENLEISSKLLRLAELLEQE